MLREAGVAFDERPVVLAAWFDAVYEPFSATNEEDSADLARELLAGDPDRDEVAVSVELTKTHEPAADDPRRGRAVGCRLRGAGGRCRPVRRVRREHPGRVQSGSSGDLRTKRAELLTEFLSRPEFSYLHRPTRWESVARANIEREIGELR